MPTTSLGCTQPYTRAGVQHTAHTLLVQHKRHNTPPPKTVSCCCPHSGECCSTTTSTTTTSPHCTRRAPVPTLRAGNSCRLLCDCQRGSQGQAIVSTQTHRARLVHAQHEAQTSLSHTLHGLGAHTRECQCTLTHDLSGTQTKPGCSAPTAPSTPPLHTNQRPCRHTWGVTPKKYNRQDRTLSSQASIPSPDRTLALVPQSLQAWRCARQHSRRMHALLARGTRNRARSDSTCRLGSATRSDGHRCP